MGSTVVLPAAASYHARYPNDPAQVFRHRLFQPNYYLAERLAVGVDTK